MTSDGIMRVVAFEVARMRDIRMIRGAAVLCMVGIGGWCGWNLGADAADRRQGSDLADRKRVFPQDSL